MNERYLPRAVEIVEVGPRDGLQNEAVFIPTAEKISFINRLSDAGHSKIEVTAFVSPTRIPQLADAVAVFAGIVRWPGVCYAALVPNLIGLGRARDAGADEVAIVPAASNTFGLRNINQTIAQGLATARDVCRDARAAGLPVRACLSTSFGCPFEGPVPPARVREMAAQLLDFGASEVVLCDTVGIAHPGQVSQLLDELLKDIPLDRLALHFHDTRGTALVNVYAGLEAGVTSFEASAGGLGGCPFAPGVAGNVATEDLLYMLNGLRIATKPRLDAILKASRTIESHLGRLLPSRVFRAAQATDTTGQGSPA